jgi:hypothetical protein
VASPTRQLKHNSGAGNSCTHEAFSPSRAPHNDIASRRALQRGSAPKMGCGQASVKDKAKVLLDSEVGTSRDLPPQVRNLFLER